MLRSKLTSGSQVCSSLRMFCKRFSHASTSSEQCAYSSELASSKSWARMLKDITVKSNLDPCSTQIVLGDIQGLEVLQRSSQTRHISKKVKYNDI